MHLSRHPPSIGIEIFSGFVKALEESRIATNRDPATGTKLPGLSQASWLGAIGYMALLDQIGSCFKPRVEPIQPGNTISKALHYFSTLTASEIDALYALRCAFAHDFSLYNINHNNSALTHCFKVSGGASGSIVTLPTQRWSGNYQNKPDDAHTVINLELFGDLVESICVKLFSLANSVDLDVALEGGSDELLQRYAFFRKHQED